MFICRLWMLYLTQKFTDSAVHCSSCIYDGETRERDNPQTTREETTKPPKRKTTSGWYPPKPEQDNHKPDGHATYKRTVLRPSIRP